MNKLVAVRVEDIKYFCDMDSLIESIKNGEIKKSDIIILDEYSKLAEIRKNYSRKFIKKLNRRHRFFDWFTGLIIGRLR